MPYKGGGPILLNNFAIAGNASVSFDVQAALKITVLGELISGNNVAGFLGIRLNSAVAGYDGGLTTIDAGVIAQGAIGVAFSMGPMNVLADTYNFVANLTRLTESSQAGNETWMFNSSFQNSAGSLTGFTTGKLTLGLLETLDTLIVRTSAGLFDAGRIRVILDD